MPYKLMLLVLATVIPILGEFKEEFRKSVYRYIAILLLLIAAIVQFKDDRDSEKDSREKFKTTIDKADSSIKQIVKAQKNIDTLRDSLFYQLRVQKEMNMKSETLLTQNKKLSDNLKTVSGNVDDMAYPLFPMTVAICAELPIDKAPDALKSYILDLKRNYNTDKHFDKSNIYVTRNEATEVHDTLKYMDIRKVQETLTGNVLEQYNWEARFDFQLIKANSFIPSRITSRTPQINFNIGEDERDYKSSEKDLFVDFTHQKMYVVVGYFNHSFEAISGLTSPSNFTNANISSKDLPFCYLAAHSSASILAISISANNGLQRPVSMMFAAKDTARSGNQKLQYHKIKASDFDNYDQVQAIIAKRLPGF